MNFRSKFLAILITLALSMAETPSARHRRRVEPSLP
jgi:hypothetical protein